jgi:hypothetical protein
MVLRRLAGETSNTAPVLTRITQFGGGKTHTLTALYHIARTGAAAVAFPGVATLLEEAGLTTVPQARVGVFVGNAWDPHTGRETPWLDPGTPARRGRGGRGAGGPQPRPHPWDRGPGTARRGGWRWCAPPL